MAHLTGEKSDGSDVIGIYPLLPDDTCRFLVFDFDDHEASPGTVWQEDVDALLQIWQPEQVCLATWNVPVPAAAHMSGCFLIAPDSRRAGAQIRISVAY